MEGICEIIENNREDWVVFNDDFDKELSPDTIQFLSKYQKVMFEYDFNQPVDNLPILN